MWTYSIDDEDGRTEAVIQNMTIEGARRNDVLQPLMPT
jgi:hypothetical protein